MKGVVEGPSLLASLGDPAVPVYQFPDEVKLRRDGHSLQLHLLTTETKHDWKSDLHYCKLLIQCVSKQNFTKVTNFRGRSMIKSAGC